MVDRQYLQIVWMASVEERFVWGSIENKILHQIFIFYGSDSFI